MHNVPDYNLAATLKFVIKDDGKLKIVVKCHLDKILSDPSHLFLSMSDFSL